MKFYLDFEATQFSRRIISIGCIAENGAKFTTLVKPVNNNKVGKYITQLTGITDEMVSAAPTADEAFMNFQTWFLSQETGLPQFFAYGNDEQYIDATIRYMENPFAIMFANSIKGCLVDYSKIVANHIRKRGVSLRALVSMIETEKEVVQHHDAMEDAEWLKLVDDNLKILPVCEEIEKITQESEKTTKILSVGPFPNMSFKNMPKEPEHIAAWTQYVGNKYNPYLVPHEGDKDNWVVRAWNPDGKGAEIFFASYYDAMYWATKMKRKVSCKKAGNNRSTWNSMIGAAKNGTRFCKAFWEIKPIEQEIKE